MKLEDERYIQIVQTLEKVERLNRAIDFHEQQEEVDQLAVEQYRTVKAQLTEQLIDILRSLNLDLELAA